MIYDPATIHKCPACGKKMIRRSTGVVLTSYPAQYPWNWWCGCGHSVEGGVEHAVFLPEDDIKRAWKKINQAAVTQIKCCGTCKFLTNLYPAQLEDDCGFKATVNLGGWCSKVKLPKEPEHPLGTFVFNRARYNRHCLQVCDEYEEKLV